MDTISVSYMVSSFVRLGKFICPCGNDLSSPVGQNYISRCICRSRNGICYFPILATSQRWRSAPTCRRLRRRRRNPRQSARLLLPVAGIPKILLREGIILRISQMQLRCSYYFKMKCSGFSCEKFVAAGFLSRHIF